MLRRLQRAYVFLTVFFRKTEITSDRFDRLAVADAAKPNGFPRIQSNQPPRCSSWGGDLCVKPVLREEHPRSVRGSISGCR